MWLGFVCVTGRNQTVSIWFDFLPKAWIMLLWYWKWNENTRTSSQSLPESSDTLSGVLIGPVCSTSTWISSVSSMFFLLELFLWLLVSRDRGLLLSLLFLLSPGSLRSSRSNVEERTARKTQEQVRPPSFTLLILCLFLFGAVNLEWSGCLRWTPFSEEIDQF